MSIPISSLPEEIYPEILVRLPVKSLLRFKCVCKYLYSLIRSTYFIKKHMNHSIQKNDATLIFRDDHKRKTQTQLISLQSLLVSPSSSRDHSFLTSRKNISFCGSSNGLLCICCVCCYVDDLDDDEHSRFCENDGDERIVVLNPSTREFKKIHVRHKRSERRAKITSLYWFGHDHKINDYKLVRVVGFDTPGKESFEVEVYTLGSDSWGKIENVCYKFEKGHPGVLVNGALHWFVVSAVSQLKVLVSFDISNERFVEVSLPKEPLTYPEESLEDVKYGKNVGELGGSLCLLFHVFGVRVDVWVMQEYGVRESWTKSFTITEETITKTCYLGIKWSFMNNKILLQGDDKLILYDPKNETYRRLVLCETNMDAISYVTSLVSLNTGRYLKQMWNKRKRQSMKKTRRDYY